MYVQNHTNFVAAVKIKRSGFWQKRSVRSLAIPGPWHLTRHVRMVLRKRFWIFPKSVFWAGHQKFL